MVKRIISLCVMLSLLLSCVPFVSASSFSDLKGHWATKYIEDVVEAGLFNGVSGDRFSPDTTMTRGMFVTVLGRFEGIDTDYWNQDAIVHLFNDVPLRQYYTPHVRWAYCKGIVNGMSHDSFAPDAPITREQMAKLVAFYAEKMGHSFIAEEPPVSEPPVTEDPEVDPSEPSVTEPESPEPADPSTEDPAGSTRNPDAEATFVFADDASISSWAKSSVYALCEAGILTGSRNSDGTFSFHPQDSATRAECATVFARILKSLHKNETTASEDLYVILDTFDLDLYVGDSYCINATTYPYDAPVTWYSSDPEIVSVDQGGMITCLDSGTAIITAYTSSGYYNNCYVVSSYPIEPEPPVEEYPMENMWFSEKTMLVFGEEFYGDPRGYYSTYAEAKANLTTVEIRAWDISKKTGEKYTRTFNLEVHKNLAAAVIAIFEEIYNGPEKFPIHQVYSFNWGSGTSEHSMGTAIDINWDENYYCYPDGTAITGKYWKPGEDPYSIIPGGDVETAFRHYGYSWGINWSSGKKDYMHFSFFGY